MRAHDSGPATVGSLFDAVVVGAGPAGSAAATVLAGAGRRVALFEKDRFPRSKVCGEFLSADALPLLERLGAREALEGLGPERIERGSILPARGRPVAFRLPATALGISRLKFDDLLARRAAQSGARVHFGTRILAIEREPSTGFRVRLTRGQAESEIRARAVIGAWGRWDSLDRRLERGFLTRSRRFFGWSRDFLGDARSLAGQVRLYLFPGGYCGLSRIEGGAVNLAGVVSEKAFRRAGSGWEEVCRHARRTNPSLDADLSDLDPGPIGFLVTGPVFFTAKPPVEEGILMAGDAAGVIDPFSGQGQAAALASGILAGETVERFLSGELPPGALGQVYEKLWKSRFGRRFAWSALLRRLMLRPTLGRLAGRLAGERLVRFGVAATAATRVKS
jgi:flavin-dependent dehydrogenase